MAIKISNCLDAALALTTFDLTKEEVKHSYLDHAALTLLRDESSIAYQELRNRLHEWELQQLPARIIHLITEQPDQEQLSPKDFFSDIRRQLLNNSKEQMVTSLHLLRLIVAKTDTANEYGIVLLAATQYLHQACDVVISTNYWVELSLFGDFG